MAITKPYTKLLYGIAIVAVVFGTWLQFYSPSPAEVLTRMAKNDAEAHIRNPTYAESNANLQEYQAIEKEMKQKAQSAAVGTAHGGIVLDHPITLTGNQVLIRETRLPSGLLCVVTTGSGGKNSTTCDFDGARNDSKEPALTKRQSASAGP